MKCITYRIDDEKGEQLKNYCIECGVSIQKLLDNHIDITLLAWEKSKYRYCGCGIDLFTLSPQDRLLHVQNCKSNHNR